MTFECKIENKSADFTTYYFFSKNLSKNLLVLFHV